METEKMKLELLKENLTVCKVNGIGDALVQGKILFIGKTESEISVVCETEYVPENASAREDGWRALRVAGTLDFSLTGILSSLSSTLAENGVGIFAVSTFDTDYILVKARDLEKAVRALENAGHTFA